MNNTYVYRHRRVDTNKVFYVGIGSLKRSAAKDNRNKYWKHITNKTEYLVDIVARDLSWKDAAELEILLIKEYGRIDNKTGILCNLTDGGEGSIGRKVSEETRKKLGNGSRGNKWNLGRKLSEVTKLKISNSRIGKKYKGSSRKVIDCDSKIIYNSCNEAAIYLKISPSTLTYHLKVTTSKFNFKYYE